MAKISQAQWDKAKVLIEGGESISSASKQVGIERSTLSKKAKSLSWTHGKNHGVIVDEARVIAEKSQLNSQELEYHNKEVDRLTKDMQMIHSLSRGNLSGLSKHIKAGGMEVMDCKIAQDTIDKASVTLGINPRFANTVINNTNAQQENNNLQVRIVDA